MADYYELLGISREIDGPGIKAAYRKLALRYHPDKNPGDSSAEERFKELNEAYAVLSDPSKRAHYDRFGTADMQMPFAGGDIFDIFASVFGTGGFAAGAGRVRRTQPGEDLETQLSITLEQALHGESVPLDIERLGFCDRCHGSREEPGHEGRKTCPTCHGAGQVRHQTQSIFGAVTANHLCPHCRGLGEVVITPCGKCMGAGREKLQATVNVKLPKGIDGGYRLRIPLAGNLGLDGAEAGDLYVFIDLEKHPQFTRKGDDLFHELTVGVAQAALGSNFEVPTLEEPEVLRLKPGTQPGAEFRLRGKGMPRLQGLGRGDLIVKVQVHIPTDLTPKAKDLLEAYAGEAGEALEQPEGIGSRARDFLGKKREKRRH